MIYQLNQLKTILQGVEIATAAGVASMSNRVFIAPDVDEFVGQVNVGRLPCIVIKEVEVDYSFDASPDHFTTRNANHIIRIIVPSFLNRHQTKYELLQRIKTACIAQLNLAANDNLEITDMRASSAVVVPYGLYLDLQITTQTSSDNTFDEE